MTTKSTAMTLALILSIGFGAFASTSAYKSSKRIDALELELARTQLRMTKQRQNKGQLADIQDRLNLLERKQPIQRTRITRGGLAQETTPTSINTPQINALEEAITKKVQHQLDSKLDKIASRKRNHRGEWKAPIQELSEELGLSKEQRKNTTAIFDEARNDAFALLNKTRKDGSSLLDDFAKDLKDNASPKAAWGKLFKRMFSETVPETNKTYIESFITMRKGVMTSLAEELDDDQMSTLKKLKIDPLDVQTGYDPVKDYITAKLAKSNQK